MADLLFDILFLAPLFFVGSICCYTDIKYGKIKNKWILIGLIWVAFIYAALTIYTIFFLHCWENINYLIKALINGFTAFFLGYLLWYFKLWAAGDAKLFTLFAFLIPLKFYSKSYFSYFPSLTLLINLFIPLIFWLMIKATISGIKEIPSKLKEFEQKNKLFSKEWLGKLGSKIWKAAKTFLTFLAIFIVMQMVMKKMSQALNKIVPNLSIIFLSFFLLYRYIFKFIQKNKFVTPITGSIAVLYASYLLYSGQMNVLFNIFKMVFLFMIVIGFLRKFLDSYIEKKEVRKLKIKELKEGMMITEDILIDFAKKFKEKDFKNKFGKISPDGLSSEQVKFLKKLFSQEPEKEIKIYKTFPFSPFLMLGACITILTRDSLLSIILRILRVL